MEAEAHEAVAEEAPVAEVLAVDGKVDLTGKPVFFLCLKL